MSKAADILLSVGILAGGKSRRFGSPKGLLVVDGKRMIDRMLDLASALSDDVYLSIGNDNHYPDLNIPLIADHYHDCGPIGGLHALMSAVSTPWLAILPCDMPYLTASVYQQLLQSAGTNEPVVACSKAGLEPLVSLWPKATIEAIEASVKARRFSLQGLCRNLQCRKVTIEQAGAGQPSPFLNINRPEDVPDESKAPS